MLINELPGEFYRKRKAGQIKRVVIHHAAAGKLDGNLKYYRDFISTVDKYHRDKHGWPRIAYHYIIDPLGNVYKCNPYLSATCHAKGANTDGIGVMLIGNFDVDQPPVIMLDKARELVQELREGIPSLEQVCGHRDVRGSKTACPGKHLTDAMIAAMW